MKRKHALIMVLATVILAAVAFHSSTRKVPDKGIGGTSTGETSTSVVRQMAIASATSLAISQDEIGRKDARRQLDLALAAVKGIATASEARQVLLELRAYLASLPPELASAVIADFLSDPSRDAPTRIEFSIGKTGFLDGHPTLRVALLDWLGQIHPAQAGVVAEKILATPTHADEWAVSLRNYARASSDSESREFLQAKTEELIRNQVWRENPSVGFLEAFDILVHAHATESSALLGELVADQTPEGKAIAHAAYLTLDRLTICEPVAMMKQLAGQPNLTKVRGPMVANMFARADLRDPEQRKLVRDYLLDPARRSGELDAFAGVYPNASFAISKNLLTETRTPTGEELAAHDAAVFEIIKTWLKDPALERVKPYLTTMHNRLAAFVHQASR